MNSKLKLGELFLYKDEWKVCFSCFECGLEVEEIEQFMVHSLEHRLVVPSDDMITLMRQIYGFKNNGDLLKDVKVEMDDNEPHENPPTDYDILVEDDIDPLISKMDSFDDDLSADMSDEESVSDLESILNEIDDIIPPPPSPSASAPMQSTESSTTGEHKCHLCPKTFDTRRALTNHKRCHKKTRVYTCTTCGAVINDASNYSAHVKRHLNIKLHKCDECAKTFFTASELKIHMRSHTGELPYTCHLCGQSFKHSSILSLHRRRIHTKERPHMCTHCAKRFFTLSQLREHEDSHNKERKYPCPICNKYFGRRASLLQHKQLHGEKKYTCEVCDKKFSQSAGLYSHMKFHRKSNNIIKVRIVKDSEL